MMIEVLAQLSNATVWLAVGAVVFFVAQTVFFKRMLKGLNSDVGDKHGPLSATDSAEITEGNGFRTSVATPRPRKLQPPPARQADEPPATDSPVLTDVLPASKAALPVSPATAPAPEPELAKPVLASAGTAVPAVDVRKDVPAPAEVIVPTGALIPGPLALAKDAAPTASKVETPVAPAPKIETPAAPATPARTLPPLAVSEPVVPSPLKPADMPAVVPVAARRFFTPAAPAAPAAPTGALTMSSNPPPSGETANVSAKEVREVVTMSALSPMIPAPAEVNEKPVSLPGGSLPPLDVPVSPEPPKDDKPAVAPKSGNPGTERVGSGLIAIGAPVKLTGDAAVPPPLAAGALPGPVAEADDVKKKAPPSPDLKPAANAGLILIPPADPKSELAGVKVTETPAVKPAAKTEAVPVPEPVKTGTAPAAAKPAEPVLSPAVADAAPAATPAADKPEVEAKPIKGPRVFLPGKFFGGSKKDKEPAAKTPEPAPLPEATKEPAALAKVEPALVKITEPSSAPALIVPPVEEVTGVDEKPAAVVEETKAAEVIPPPDGKAPVADAAESILPEPARPEPAAVKTPETPAVKAEPAANPLAAPAPEAKVEPLPASQPAPALIEPVAPPAPAGKALEEAVAPVPVPPLPTEQKSVPPSIPAHALVASSSEKPVESGLPTQAGPTTEPMAEPIASVLVPPAASKPVEPAAPAPEATPAPATPVPIPSIRKPQPVMPPTDTTTSLPNTGRASAQLTLAFEVTSLQLTPFFKLGSVQLKALSNVVSLHLVAAQADNPLAAGISFQIEHVDLDGSAHLKSILLKPLGESRSITAPLPKLQVDNVAVTGGGEGAPISVTTSEQASTAVQLFGTFTIAAMDFTPAFEIGSLRLEPNSNTVLLRVAPSSRPTALDLPPSFEIAAVQLGDGAQITGVRVTPSAAKAA